MKKRIVLITALALLLAFCIFAIWYHIPIRMEGEIGVASIEPPIDGAETLSIKLKRYRYFFKPDELRGSITFRGKTYVQMKSSSNGFWRNLDDKIHGTRYPEYFYNAELIKNPIDAFGDYFWLIDWEWNLNGIVFGLPSHEIFAGPADTWKQAQNIRNRLAGLPPLYPEIE